MCDAFVNIDGSLLEGGGQMLRMASTLSALTGKPIRVCNIRAGRSKPGLMAQHLKGLQLITQMTGGNIKGDKIGSTEIEFWPKKIHGGFYTADTQTAGSIGLLLQVSLPCAYFANCETTLKLRGGTNAEMAPQIDYTTEVFRSVLEKFHATFDFELKRRGYFPKGGGEVLITVQPVKVLQPITLLERGEITAIYGWSFVAGSLPMVVAHKMAEVATNVIREAFPSVNVNIERYKENSQVAPDNCSGIILVTETSTGCIIGSSALGRRNVSAENTGVSAGEELVNTLSDGSCVDKYSQDQIIIFMALANGVSQVRVGKITLHTETAIYVAEMLTKVKFEIIPDGKTTVIRCRGIGLQNTEI